MERDYGFDNIKGILIFCVVLGHLLECVGAYLPLYRIIYLFHMPVFLFVSGFFAKSGVRAVAEKIWLYGLFQTLYIVWERLVKPADIPLQYHTPYWILWYLFVLIFYTALIPLYRATSGKKRAVALGISLALSLAAGFSEKIGYTFSLSRFFVFQPYFLLGLYAKEQPLPPMGNRKLIFVSAGAAVLSGIAFLPQASSRLLYGAVCYTDAKDVLFRLGLAVTAVLWIAVFRGLCDRMKGKIPLLSAVGRYTMPVYLLHGFILRLMTWGILPAPQHIWSAILLTVPICILLGNKVMGKFVMMFSPFRYQK